MKDELALEKNQTWELVKLPADKKAISVSKKKKGISVKRVTS